MLLQVEALPDIGEEVEAVLLLQVKSSLATHWIDTLRMCCIHSTSRGDTITRYELLWDGIAPAKAHNKLSCRNCCIFIILVPRPTYIY